MTTFSLADVALALESAELITDRRGTLPVSASAITDDSRHVAPGTVFIAVRGTERNEAGGGRVRQGQHRERLGGRAPAESGVGGHPQAPGGLSVVSAKESDDLATTRRLPRHLERSLDGLRPGGGQEDGGIVPGQNRTERFGQQGSRPAGQLPPTMGVPLELVDRCGRHRRVTVTQG